MRTGGNSALTVRGACLAAGLAFLLASAHADGPGQIVIGDESVSIWVEDRSIRSILEDLSRQSDLVVVSQEALDESVTVHIDEPTLPVQILQATFRSCRNGMIRGEDSIIHISMGLIYLS